MRRLILLVFVFVTVLATSCSKDEIDDFTKPENISGTIWKCTLAPNWDKDLEYALLSFTSSTTVEGWTKYVDKEEQKDWTGSFSISNDRISISYESETFTGIIVGENINTTIDEETYVFSKQ
jgi:hypothetical protein